MIDAINTPPGEAPGAAERLLRQYAQLAAIVIIVAGCYLVVHPFIPAILFAAVVCSATWPLHVRLRKALWGRPALAALAMTLLLVVLVIGPTVLLAVNLADTVTAAIEAGKAMLNGGPIKPPPWVREIPLVGELLSDYWQRVASSGDSLATQWKGLLEPARKFLVDAGKAAGEGLLQLALAIFIGFFFYRDGEALILAIRQALDKIAGGLGKELLETIDNTVTGVVHGIFGTALAQSLVALAGFLIAGVPAAFLLTVATFFLSVVPIGPPLVWGGAAAWLASQDQLGWAVFMVVYGIVAISGIDNVVKPMLLRGSAQIHPLLGFLSILGGVFVYGVAGFLVGPVILSLVLSAIRIYRMDVLRKPSGPATPLEVVTERPAEVVSA